MYAMNFNPYSQGSYGGNPFGGGGYSHQHHQQYHHGLYPYHQPEPPVEIVYEVVDPYPVMGLGFGNQYGGPNIGGHNFFGGPNFFGGAQNFAPLGFAGNPFMNMIYNTFNFFQNFGGYFPEPEENECAPVHSEEDDVTINTYECNDTITSKGHGVTIRSREGNDTITSEGDDVIIRSGEGNDTVNATGDDNSIYAGAGNDTITIDGNGNYVETMEGNDQVVVLGDNNVIDTDDDPDQVRIKGNNNTVNVGGKTDEIVVYAEADGNTIEGIPGNGLNISVFEGVESDYTVTDNGDGTKTVVHNASGNTNHLVNIDHVFYFIEE